MPMNMFERVKCQEGIDQKAASSTITAPTENAAAGGIAEWIRALDSHQELVRESAARGLAILGATALRSLLHSIAFGQHETHFYRSAHHSLYFLQFHAPLRDRAILSSLLESMVGPNPALESPSLAQDIIQT